MFCNCSAASVNYGYKFHWAMFECVTKGGLLCTPGCEWHYWLPVSKMRIVNDAGRCFACSDADSAGRSEDDTVGASDDDDAD